MAVTTMKSLPKELVEEIFAKVGTRSIVDLCMVKLCSKDFLHAAENDYVYHHVSMENFALVPLPWFKGEKEAWFLKRCKESGNPEISYREGMVQYFTYSMVESGLEDLKKAALENHDEARYVYCMLLMCREDERERKQGFDLFCSWKKSTCVSRCRKRVKSFIHSMWVKNNNPVVKNHKYFFCGNNSGTCDIERFKKLSRKNWWSLEDEDTDSSCVSCECLGAAYELSLFWNMLGI